MIKIVLLLLLFLLYAYISRRREGLKNYLPIVGKDTSGNEKIYGVNVIKDHENHIYLRLTNPRDKLYQPRFKEYHRSDVILDMQYFNNASYLMQAYNVYL